MQVEVVVDDGTGRRRPVTVAWGHDHRVRDLRIALGDHVGTTIVALVRRRGLADVHMDDEQPLDRSAIARGDLLHGGRAMPPTPHLLGVAGGPDAGRLLPIGSRPLTLGRAGDADLVIDDPVVSRRHCRLHVVGDALAVEDLDSSNGTTVDDVPAAGRITAGRRLVVLGATAVRLHDTPPGGDAVTATGHIAVAARFGGSPTLDVIPAPFTARPPTDARAADLRNRLDLLHPDLSRCHLAVLSRDRLLWSRQLSTLRIGRGTVVVHEDGHRTTVACGPVVVDLTTGWIAVHGPDDLPSRVVAALVLRAAVLVGPADLDVCVLAASPIGWEWLHWLPHAGGLHVGVADALGALDDLSRSSRPRLVVVDAVLVDRLAEHLPDAGVVIVGPHPADVTAEVHEDGTMTLLGSSVHGLAVGADGVSGDTADEIARGLAPLTLHDTSVEVTGRPHVSDLLPATDVVGIGVTWDAVRPRSIPVGRGPHGVVGIPMDGEPLVVVADDPTEVIEALVVGVAATIEPSRLGVVVPRASLSTLAGLPHVLAPPEGRTPGEEVRAELVRRRRQLAAVGVDDWETLRLTVPDAAPPLLVLEDRPTDLSVEDDRELAVQWLGTVTGASTERVLDVRAGTIRTTRGTTPLDVVTTHRVTGSVDVLVTDLGPDGSPVTATRTRVARIGVRDDAVGDLVAACVEAARNRALPRWTEAVKGAPPPRVRRTFVFTDIQGSTALAESVGDRAWADLVRWHDRVLREVAAAHQGVEVDHTGDGFLFAFVRAEEATAFGCAAQRRLDRHRREGGFAPRVRIGGHVTEVLLDDGYRGHGLHVAARIGGLADGDEVVFSVATIDEAGPASPPGMRQRVMVRGSSEPIDVVTLDWRLPE